MGSLSGKGKTTRCFGIWEQHEFEAFGCRCPVSPVLAPACAAARFGLLLSTLSRLTHIHKYTHMGQPRILVREYPETSKGKNKLKNSFFCQPTSNTVPVPVPPRRAPGTSTYWYTPY